VNSPCGGGRGRRCIGPPDRVRTAIPGRKENRVRPVREFVERPRGNEVPGHKNGNQDEEQKHDEASQPKDRRLPVAATPQSAAMSGLALDSVPQHKALPRRVT
jgi:hypothetical protein